MAMSIWKVSLTIYGVCLISSIAVKVSDTECKDGQCADIEHAECDTDITTPKCKCSHGYIEDSTDESSCIKDTLADVDCTKETADQCSHTEHAECNEADTNAKCRCINGYKVDPTDDTSCIKNTLLNVDCTKETEGQCSHTEHAECDEADTNAKCRCINGYDVDPNDDTSCIRTVSGTPCSVANGGCEKIDNSICDADAGKCTCSPGFTMKIAECVGNNANSFKTGWVAFLLFFVLKYFN